MSLLRVDALLVAGSALGDAAATQVAVALSTFDLAWQAGLVLFGLHLVLVATLLVERVRAPRALRVLLGAAGAAHVVDGLLQVGLTQYASIEGFLLPVVATLSVLGEGWFAGWLLVRARRDR